MTTPRCLVEPSEIGGPAQVALQARQPPRIVVDQRFGKSPVALLHDVRHREHGGQRVYGSLCHREQPAGTYPSILPVRGHLAPFVVVDRKVNKRLSEYRVL